MFAEPGKTRNDLAAGAGVPLAAPRRRRLIGAVGGGVGVLLAVQAKTALGQAMCISMSGQMSGNTSPHSNHEVPCASGFSPGYWRQPQHFAVDWAAAGAVPPTFNATVSECVSGMGQLSPEVIQAPGTLVGDVFSGGLVGPTIGLWEVIAFSDLYDALPRHLICAWLNAGAVSGYPINRQQVLDIWSQLSTTGRYCPTSVTCTDGGLDAAQVRQMIEATYGYSASDASTMCTADDSGTVGGGSGNGGGNGNGGGKKG
ncbi:hypothetical protein [Aromatoleum sp.]|uniref:hypothetical protein n=1 Tax=Aromatoleum sp. TaxID=2307007 RepID=UPI002FCC76EC